MLVADPAHRDGLSLTGVLRIDNEAPFFKSQELRLCRGGSKPLEGDKASNGLKEALIEPPGHKPARRSTESRDTTDPTGGQHEGFSRLSRKRPITYTGLGGCIAEGLDCILAALAHGDRPEFAHLNLEVPARQRGYEDMH